MLFRSKKMKKLLLCFIASGMLFSSSINAQREQNQVVVSAGMGYSIGQALLKAILNATLEASGTNTVSSIPIINVMADYGITENFSLGVAYSFNKFSWSDSIIDTSGVISSVDLSAARHNIGVRPLFHFGNNEKVDLYTGARLGTSIWALSGSATDSQGNSTGASTDIPTGVVTVQALFGVRTYFTDVIGANFEVGIGNAPYFVAGGLSFKF